LFAVLISVVGAFNYLRWFKVIWFDSLPKTVGSLNKSDEKISTVSVSKVEAYVLSSGTFFLVFFMLDPSIFIYVVNRVCLSIFLLFFFLWLVFL
jgi:NADH:ubiquinone oxidoreductase subunit 2 (subunit N)